jgi:hypothetical protein
MQSRLCWKNAGISWEREEPFVTNYANALCISVSPTSPSMSRLVLDIPTSLLFSYFSIKMELFSFAGIVANVAWQTGKRKQLTVLLLSLMGFKQVGETSKMIRMRRW